MSVKYVIAITLSKYFPIRERPELKFRAEAYNLTNSFVPSDPVTNASASSSAEPPVKRIKDVKCI
jgi:hypothetical protein